MNVLNYWPNLGSPDLHWIALLLLLFYEMLRLYNFYSWTYIVSTGFSIELDTTIDWSIWPTIRLEIIKVDITVNIKTLRKPSLVFHPDWRSKCAGDSWVLMGPRPQLPEHSRSGSLSWDPPRLKVPESMFWRKGTWTLNLVAQRATCISSACLGFRFIGFVFKGRKMKEKADGWVVPCVKFMLRACSL